MILKKTEGFEDTDSESTLKAEVNTQITQVNDILCPIYKELVNNRADKIIDEHDQKIEEVYKSPLYKLASSENQKAFRDKNPKIYSMSKEQQLAFKCKAKSQAIQSINDDTTYDNSPPIRKKISNSSLLFPCPAYNDPASVPNNVDQYIQQTCGVYIQFLKEVKDKIEKALSCREGFEGQPQTDLPDDGQCAPIVAAAKAEAGKSEADKAKDAALKQQRIQALQLKSDALKRALKAPLFLSLIDKYNELKEIKSKAESGQLKPSCAS